MNNEITDKLQTKITFLHFMQIIFCIISTGKHQKENLDFNFFLNNQKKIDYLPSNNNIAAL